MTKARLIVSSEFADGPEEGGRKVARDYLSFAGIAIRVDGRVSKLGCWQAAASSAGSIAASRRA